MYKAWHYDEGDKQYFGVKDTQPRLAAGLYTMGVTMTGAPAVHQIDLRQDVIYPFQSGPQAGILKEVDRFWDTAPKYARLGMTHKRGLLLYGPPGNGKSATIGLMLQQLVAADGLAFQVRNSNAVEMAAHALPLLRQIEKDRHIVIVIEDLDRIAKHGEEELLELMDGSSNIGQGVMFVATTNFLNKVPTRIRNRPSRIDTLIKVGNPRAALRREYLTQTLKTMFNGEEIFSPNRLTQVVEATKGFSLASLKEVLLSVIVYDISVEDTVKRLRQLLPTPASENGEAAPVEDEFFVED